MGSPRCEKKELGLLLTEAFLHVYGGAISRAPYVNGVREAQRETCSCVT